MNKNILRKRLRRHSTIVSEYKVDLRKLAVLLKFRAQKFEKDIRKLIGISWLHFELDGIFTLKETDEKTLDTQFVTRVPKIKNISAHDGFIFFDKPFVINTNNYTCNLNFIDIRNLPIYKKYIEDRTELAESYFIWPTGEIVNTGRSKAEIIDFLCPKEKTSIRQGRPIRSITL